MNTMRSLIVALLSLAQALPTGSAASANTPASPDVYQVTAIVFAIHEPRLDGHEDWALESNPPPAVATAVPPVPGLPARSALAPVVRKLSADPRYEVLSVTHWLQEGLPPDKANPMLITSANHRLLGTIQVYEMQYVHAAIDLALAPSTPSTTSGPPVTYTLSESRRLHPGKLEYFDHPKLGVLLLVSNMDKGSPAR